MVSPLTEQELKRWENLNATYTREYEPFLGDYEKTIVENIRQGFEQETNAGKRLAITLLEVCIQKMGYIV